MTRHASEDEVQYAVARVLDAMGVLWCHVPNEALQRGGIVYGGILVGLGVKTGVPDVLIFDRPPGQIAMGVAIELKSQVGRPSADQERWLTELAGRGWHTAVCQGVAATLAELRALGWPVDDALKRLEATGQVLEGDRMSRPSAKARGASKAKPQRTKAA